MTALKLDTNTVYLVDGSGYIFRAYYAIRHLRSKTGVPTNAVFGFTTMLLKLLKEHKPAYIAIAFDQKEPTFRHKLYKEYKANRDQPPEDLVPQFSLIHRVVSAMNIKLLTLSGYEADDIISTLTKKAHKEGHKVVIVTGDKDLMQLVDDKTFLLDELRAQKYGQETLITAKEVKEEFGVTPKQVIDVLALAGDLSDNIPGVSGIGKKTAAELINEYDSLENVLEMAPLIKQKSRREKIIAGHKDALLSKQLVLLDSNVPVDCQIGDLSYEGVNKEALKTLFLELDFNRLLSDETLFGKDAKKGHDIVVDEVVDRTKYKGITNEADFLSMLEKLIGVEKFALDTETDGLNSTTANLVGLAIAWAPDEAVYIPLAHDEKIIPYQLSLDVIKSHLNPILSSGKIMVAQNAKFDHKVLLRNGFVDFMIGGDPMLQSYLLYQDQEKHNLSFLSEKYLHHKGIAYEEICGPKNNQISFKDVGLEKAVAYSAEDADLALRLEILLLEKLQLDNLDRLYHELELPLIGVLSRMEIRGVLLDKAKLFRAGEELEERLSAIEKSVFEKAGCVFNLSSPKQVAEVLFDKLKLPVKKKTKTGYSTDSSVLEELITHHELPGLLLEHRMLSKLINTYIETLPKLINKTTGRIHTSYNQFVTATGRLSSSDPNLQNIPARSKEGQVIRAAFVASSGYKLISLDYSQVELRILAFVSKDPVLLDSFAKDEDVHNRTASEIFDVPTDKVNKEQRAAAKTINFGLLYGMGVHRLAQTLKIPRKEAQKYLDKYYERYRGVFAWKNDSLLLAREKQEVRTLFGRRRLCKEITSKNSLERSRAERIAINTPIQGTAADIMKKAMIDTDSYLREKFPDSYLIMQVHDELIIEAKIKDAQRIAEDVALLMSKGHGLNLDLKVDINMGLTWAEAG